MIVVYLCDSSILNFCVIVAYLCDSSILDFCVIVVYLCDSITQYSSTVYIGIAMVYPH